MPYGKEIALEPNRAAQIVVDQRLHEELRLCPANHAGCPVWQVARVRPRGHRAVLCLAPPRGWDDQDHPAEAHCPGNRLALPQRAEKGVEGIKGSSTAVEQS